MSETAVREVSLRIGDTTQVDVLLPANSQLAVVLGDVEEYLAAYLDSAGAADTLPDTARGWRLRTTLGTLLDNTRSLASQGVRSGAPLYLIAEPAGEEFTPRVENVSAAVARFSETLFRPATPAAVTTMLLGFSSGMLAAALTFLIVATFATRSWVHVGAVLGAVAVIAVVAIGNARTARRRDLADICAAALIVFAPLSLSLTLPASWGRWTGPHLLITAAGVAALAVLFMATTGRYRTAYTALAVVAALTAGSQLASVNTLIPGPAVICVLVVIVVVALGRAEMTAQRLARVPVSMFPSGSGRFIGRRVGPAGSDTLEPTDAPPDPAELFDRTRRSNDYLTGIVIGLAVAATALTALIGAAHPYEWSWLAFAAGVPIVFAYSTWFYAGRRNVAVLLAGVFGPALALCVMLAVGRGVWWGAAGAAAVAVLALVAPASIPTESRPQSPLLRGARVLSGYVVTAAVLLAPLLLLRIPQMVYNRDFS